MLYFYGSTTDTSFAVYLQDGRYFPVFTERYGSEPVSPGALDPITDPETIYALDKYMHPYQDGKKRIYMAGPLFNEGDRSHSVKQTSRTSTERLSSFRSVRTWVFAPPTSPPLIRVNTFILSLPLNSNLDIMI